MIPADGDQIRQVAINLILNAGAAMNGRGMLTVATRREEQYAVMTFADTGCGIDEENLARIFEPFFTTKERGTGLGLAITRQLTELHHGTIQIASNPGAGTTVTIRLPLTREDL